MTTRYYGNSVRGKREKNEDNWIAIRPAENAFFIAVADGMGGNAGGEIASALVIRRISELVTLQDYRSDVDLKALLGDCFTAAQNVISQKTEEEPELNGLATTLTCLIIHKERYAWGSIGDSRLYIRSGDGFKLVTNDHTYLNQVLGSVENQNIELLESKYGHVLTRVIDGRGDLADIFPVQVDYKTLQGNELFMACSDGAILKKSIRGSEWINRLFETSDQLDSFVDNTISFAYENGASDNITVVAIDFGSHWEKTMNTDVENVIKEPDTIEFKQKKRSKSRSGKIIKGLLILIGMILMLMFFDTYRTDRIVAKGSGESDSLRLKKPLYGQDTLILEINEIRIMPFDSGYYYLIKAAEYFSGKNEFGKALNICNKIKEIYPGDDSTDAFNKQMEEKLDSFPEIRHKKK